MTEIASAVLSAAAERWYAIEFDSTIVAVGAGVPGALAQAVGMRLWDAYPGSEETFKCMFDAAVINGNASAVVVYEGKLVELSVWRRGDRLVVSFNYLTIAGLREALQYLEDLGKAVPPSTATGEPRARHLRVLPQ